MRLPRTRRALLSAGAIAVLLTSTILVLSFTAIPDRVALNGTWRILEDLRPDSVPETASTPGAARTIQIDGFQQTYHESDRTAIEPPARFWLDPSKRPRRIFLAPPMPDGAVPANGWDGIIRGIYEWDGPRLKLCITLGGGPAAKTFPTSPTPGVRMMVLARDARRTAP